MSNSTLYVIGKRGLGVLFVRIDPFRASLVSDEKIREYEALHNGVDGYAKIAAAARILFAESDGKPETALGSNDVEGIYQLIAGGGKVSEVDFTFAATLDDSTWDVNRLSWAPIQEAAANVGSQSTGPGDLSQVLQMAELSDT